MSIYLDLKNKIDMYFGEGSIGILFLCALLFWIAKKEKSRQLKFYVSYVVVALIGMMNPVSLYVIDKTGNMEVFERFFWLLMTTFLLAFTFAVFVHRKGMLLIPVLVLLLLCGKIVFTDTEYKPAENAEKVSEQAIRVSEIIMRDFEGLADDAKVEPNRQGVAMPTAMVTEPINEAIRMYNANIDLWYVRKNFGNYNSGRYKSVASLLTMDNQEIPVRRVVNAMREKNFEYLVLGDWQRLTGNVDAYDFEIIGSTENYRVYKYVPQDRYKMMQFADVNGYQCMSYVIYNPQRGLVVVDGGRAWQSKKLVRLIRKRGGVVDAWIITHAHDDHAGVLASVLEAEWHKSKIEIKEVLIGEMDYEAVKAQDPEHAGMVDYLQMGLDKLDNVRVLKAGDELEVIGLDMKVLHTCNETVVKNSDNILNDGSMVFKLSGKKRSVLFLADTADNSPQIDAEIVNPSEGSEIGRLIADEILENYPDDVKSWAVQMSHHGNGSYPDYFYQAISPRYAFFPAPEWLLENRDKETGEESYYSTPHYLKLMENMGARIISFETKKKSLYLR